MKLFRLHPNVVYHRDDNGKHYTRSSAPLVIVLHSTESHEEENSSQDIRSVIDYLATPSVPASIHVVTDADGNSGRLVPSRYDAWQVAAENPRKLGIEQIGQAAQGRKVWRRHWKQLREDARWIARWSLKWDIPIKHSTEHGVCTHADLGAAGGGHWDPGDYPLRRVLFLSKLYKRALKRRRRR